jgi:hypothetical protein
MRTPVINGQYAYRASDAQWYIVDDRTGEAVKDSEGVPEQYETRQHAVAAMRCC